MECNQAIFLLRLNQNIIINKTIIIGNYICFLEQMTHRLYQCSTGTIIRVELAWTGIN